MDGAKATLSHNEFRGMDGDLIVPRRWSKGRSLSSFDDVHHQAYSSRRGRSLSSLDDAEKGAAPDLGFGDYLARHPSKAACSSGLRGRINSLSPPYSIHSRVALTLVSVSSLGVLTSIRLPPRPTPVWLCSVLYVWEALALVWIPLLVWLLVIDPRARPASRTDAAEVGQCRHGCVYLPAPKTRHCRRCDKCVSGFDHHCLWLNTCVGSCNYRPWITFVGTLFVWAVLGSCISCEKLLWALPITSRRLAVGHRPAALFTGVITTVVAGWLMVLLVLHAYLIINDMTTLEWLIGDNRRTERPGRKSSKSKSTPSSPVLGRRPYSSRQTSRQTSGSKQSVTLVVLNEPDFVGNLAEEPTTGPDDMELGVAGGDELSPSDGLSPRPESPFDGAFAREGSWSSAASPYAGANLWELMRTDSAPIAGPDIRLRASSPRVYRSRKRFSKLKKKGSLPALLGLYPDTDHTDSATSPRLSGLRRRTGIDCVNYRSAARTEPVSPCAEVDDEDHGFVRTTSWSDPGEPKECEMLDLLCGEKSMARGETAPAYLSPRAESE